jgi:2-dehydro-3-deoxyphosphogluconate aldolase/(4S)-4-hydroxy-2-oxoglutarate aldolase
VARCAEKGVPIMPGCSSPTDIEQAMEFGLDVVKLFPAQQLGGLDYIKAISAPYPNLRFMPSGGINAGNVQQYLAFEKILACGGSWMVASDLLGAGNFQEVARLCREAVHAMLGFELAHIGINAENADEAVKAAKRFEMLFGFSAKEGNSSVFAGPFVEAMKSPYLGKHGHIAISTPNVDRARAVLQRQGVEFLEDSRKTDASNATSAIYLKEEIAGFAVHLVKKAR